MNPTYGCVMRKEINKLKNLRHLIGRRLSLNQIKQNIGEMTSLQTLCYVDLNMNGAVEVIKELGKLKQIRDLGLIGVRRKDGIILSSSINEMQHLEKLHVNLISSTNDEFIDLNMISRPTKLRKLTIDGRLQKLPMWILELQNLVVFRLMNSNLTKYPMQSIKN
jgi:disease resistance protein RPM1